MTQLEASRHALAGNTRNLIDLAATRLGKVQLRQAKYENPYNPLHKRYAIRLPEETWLWIESALVDLVIQGEEQFGASGWCGSDLRKFAAEIDAVHRRVRVGDDSVADASEQVVYGWAVSLTYWLQSCSRMHLSEPPAKGALKDQIGTVFSSITRQLPGHWGYLRWAEDFHQRLRRGQLH